MKRIGVAILILGPLTFGVGWWLRSDAPGAPSRLTGEELARVGAPEMARGLNVWLVTVDTLRVDRIGCYGSARGVTPAIDALASDGVVFRHAAASAPITLPCHASILTGVDPPVHGVRHNGTFALDDTHPTMAERLKESGYATAAAVGAFVLDARYGLDRGFDHYDDEMAPAAGESVARTYVERPASAVFDAAKNWLNAHRDRTPEQPFFLWTHFFDPHLPRTAPREFSERFPDPYDAEIAFTDHTIGRLRDELRRLGVLDDTLIVLTTDHGEGLGDHGEETHTKLLYEETMAAAMIVSNPRLFDGGVVDDRLVGSIDVMPTVLSLVGAEPSSIAGPSMFQRDWDGDRALYLETLAPLLDYGWSPLYALRRGDEKFIRAPTPEYYRLDDDPDETENLFGIDPAADELATLLEQRLRDSLALDDVTQQQHPLDRAQVARFATLGYTRVEVEGQPVGVKDPKAMMAIWSRIEQSRAELHARRPAEALATIRGVLRDDRTCAKAWFQASRVYRALGETSEAVRTLERGLELSPHAAGFVTRAQYALIAMQRAKQASDRATLERERAIFERALASARERDPLSGGVHLRRGDYLAAIEGDFAAALIEFERALAVDPSRSADEARTKIEQARARLGSRR